MPIPNDVYGMQNLSVSPDTPPMKTKRRRRLPSVPPTPHYVSKISPVVIPSDRDAEIMMLKRRNEELERQLQELQAASAAAASSNNAAATSAVTAAPAIVEENDETVPAIQIVDFLSSKLVPQKAIGNQHFRQVIRKTASGLAVTWRCVEKSCAVQLIVKDNDEYVINGLVDGLHPTHPCSQMKVDKAICLANCRLRARKEDWWKKSDFLVKPVL